MESQLLRSLNSREVGNCRESGLRLLGDFFNKSIRLVWILGSVCPFLSDYYGVWRFLLVNDDDVTGAALLHEAERPELSVEFCGFFCDVYFRLFRTVRHRKLHRWNARSSVKALIVNLYTLKSFWKYFFAFFNSIINIIFWSDTFLKLFQLSRNHFVFELATFSFSETIIPLL